MTCNVKVGTTYLRNKDGREYVVVSVGRKYNPRTNLFNSYTITIKPNCGKYPNYSHDLENFKKEFTLEYEETHYYIYFVRNGQLHYERTTGTEERANERCAEIRKWRYVTDAFWTLNKIIKGAYT